VKVPDPLGYNITEMVMPDNVLYCGLLKDRQKYVSAECLFSDAVIHFAVLGSHPALKNPMCVMIGCIAAADRMIVQV